MTYQVRFRDLKERGVIESWAQLARAQERDDFPPGRLLSPQIRVWDWEDEILPWLASRPVKNVQPLKGSARARHERRMKPTSPDPVAA
jgi:hypothetical protein